MKTTRLRSLLVCALLVLAAAPAAALAQSPTAAPPADTGPRILLVRHGETTPDGTRDPALSEAGERRAETLARMLADAGITRVLSTDYRRTRATAAPAARAAGLTVELYDPSDLAKFARELRAAEGVILVVGHSNTTPALVTALGGTAGAPIAETEHDRLYILTPDGAAAATLLLRY